MADRPTFATSPLYEAVHGIALNPSRSGDGGLSAMLSSTNAPVRIDRLVFVSHDVTSQGLVRIFLQPSPAGAKSLFDEIEVSAATPSATVRSWSHELRFEDGLFLPAGAQIWVATNTADPFSAHIFGAKF